MSPFVLGTRGSRLALAQTRLAEEALQRSHPGLPLEMRVLATTGDARLDVSLSTPGVLEKGLFTKELEEALLREEIDAAVHSLKDLPVDLPPGLGLGAILPRADPSEILVSKHPGGWQGLPPRSVVGTCSLRRRNQLLGLRSDLRVVDIRGNVPTRLQKLAESRELGAVLLAKAGLDRLGNEVLPAGLQVTVAEEILPAPGQGAIAIECRSEDHATREILRSIHHEESARCVNAERELLKRLGGGCSLPLGVRSWIENGEVRLKAGLFEPGKVEWIGSG